VLRDMREAFQDAEPAEVRELLSPLVSKIELHYDHVRAGKLERNPFKHGTIFVRPTDPQLSLLFQNSGISRPTASVLTAATTAIWPAHRASGSRRP